MSIYKTVKTAIKDECTGIYADYFEGSDVKKQWAMAIAAATVTGGILFGASHLAAPYKDTINDVLRRDAANNFLSQTPFGAAKEGLGYLQEKFKCEKSDQDCTMDMPAFEPKPSEAPIGDRLGNEYSI